jgi:hypothetical protein
MAKTPSAFPDSEAIMRTIEDIKTELDLAMQRRTELWRELSAGADETKSTEVAKLNELIEALWQEARTARTRAQFGDQHSIIARARAEERLERELAKVA